MGRRRYTRKQPQTWIEWIIKLGKAAENYQKRPRKKFSKKTQQWTLANQNNLCNYCGCFLFVHQFDHIDGNRENNHWLNCQALCPNCHANKTRRMRKS